MKLALLSGIKIPEKLSIIGFDNTPFCDNSIPELSSISTNFIELGQRALSSIEKSFIDFNKNEVSTNLVPVELIDRTSTRKLN
jgi:LacI family transcriptional regulator